MFLSLERKLTTEVMKASKITHRNETRIRIDFPYNAETISKLRQISDARWSKTLGAWHVPYNSEAFEKLRALFPDLTPNPSPSGDGNLERGEISSVVMIGRELNTSMTSHDLSQQADTSRLIKKSITTEPTAENTLHERIGHDLSLRKLNDISIDITESQIILKLPKNDVDIQFIRSFKYARWNNSQFYWTVPTFGKNADKLKSYFAGRNVKVTEHEPTVPLNTSLHMVILSHLRSRKLWSEL